MPYVAKAVVLDTGSADNTYDILQEARKTFGHLQVGQIQWQDWANARNCALRKVTTEYVLVLDADELLTEEDYSNIAQYMGENQQQQYEFVIRTLYLDYHAHVNKINVLNPRLFLPDGAKFIVDGDWSEMIEFPSGIVECSIPESIATIKHFKGSSRQDESKRKDWYREGKWKNEQPIENARRNGWKSFNPARMLYPHTGRLKIGESERTHQAYIDATL